MITATKITRHTKKQERMCHSEGKSKLKEIIPEEAQTLNLLDKDFNSTVLNMLKILKETWTKK